MIKRFSNVICKVLSGKRIFFIGIIFKLYFLAIFKKPVCVLTFFQKNLLGFQLSLFDQLIKIYFYYLLLLLSISFALFFPLGV